MQLKVKIPSTQRESKLQIALQIALDKGIGLIHKSFDHNLLFILFFLKSDQNKKWRFCYWYTSKTDKIESHAPYPRTISRFCTLCLSSLETNVWIMKDNSGTIITSKSLSKKYFSGIDKPRLSAGETKRCI